MTARVQPLRVGLWLGLALLPLALGAQVPVAAAVSPAVSAPATAPEPTVAGERARIAAERAEANRVHDAQVAHCYTLFAVNTCLEQARNLRRDRLADLRRQEVALNDAERKRAAADAIRRMEERQRR
jgi:hypothetical protein